MKKRIRMLLPMLVILAMLVSLFGMTVPVMANGLDGTVNSGPGVLVIDDPLGDVGMPGTPPGITGWDMIDLRLAYDGAHDTMYVGINVETILGDADGDGDPGVTSTYLSDMGGTDHPDLGSSETAAVYFDLDQDGTYDVIAGIGGTTDYYGFSVNVFTGFFYPPYNFGTALPAHTGTISPNPDAAHPDLEFTIENWSSLPGHDDAPGFCVGAFLGSLEDAGIGEDFLDYCESPCIDVQKTVDCNDDGGFLHEDWGYAGDTGHWKVVVTNCGDTTLYDVVVWDDLMLYENIAELAPGAQVEYNYDTVVDEDTFNTVIVSGYDAAGFELFADDTAVNRVISPCIDIEKTVDCNGDGTFSDEETWYEGDEATWLVVVTNCGDSPLYNVEVWDGLYGTLDFITEFVPGDSRTYWYDTWVYVDTTNWAYAEGFDELGGTVYDEDAATNYVIWPDICIEKTVDCDGDGVFHDEETWYAGDQATWRVVVTNCGDSDLYDVLVWDGLYDGVYGGPLDLISVFPAGDSETYEYTTYVNFDTTNFAWAEGYDELGATWYDEDEATNYVIEPCIDIQKTVDCNNDGVFLDEDMGYAGDTGHWKIVVTNCGDSDLHDVYVWDDLGFSQFIGDMAPGQVVEYGYDTTVDVDTTNWAYVEGYDELGGYKYDEDDATNLVISPEICIEKLVDCDGDGSFHDEETWYAGDMATWKVIVSNCGDSDLFDIVVTDDNGHDFGLPFDLAAGADPVEFTYQTQVDVDTTNWAYVTAYDELGGAWYDTDGATNLVISPDICIEKLVDCDGDGEFHHEETWYAGDMATWKVIVSNCGDSDLFDIVVTDDNGHDFGLPFDLAAGADPVEFTYQTQVDVDTTNWAYVTAYDELGGAWYDTDGATNLVINPCIDIQKTVDCNDDGVFLDEDYGSAGDTGHWRIVVTNCGDADLFMVGVADTNGMSWGPFDLPAGDSMQFDYDTIVNETTTNLAYVVAYDVLGGYLYDEDDATNVVTGNEGCTPGYWKNNAINWEAVAWNATPYDPDMLVGDVFTIPSCVSDLADDTLLEALSYKGGNGVLGGARNLLRAAVAALLNASHPDINYYMSEQGVIDAVNAALATCDRATMLMLYEELDFHNNDGCVLDMHGYPIIVDDGVI